jgi:hypothetical protein
VLGPEAYCKCVDISLEKELGAYKRLLPTLLKDDGKFALIHGSELVGIYADYEKALTEGYEKFGTTPFLVKQINAVEQVLNFTREISSCQ